MRKNERWRETLMMKLAKKEYWRNFEPSPAWVVLLIPNQGMFRAALEYDPTLLDSGTQQHVLLASPITQYCQLNQNGRDNYGNPP